VCGFVALRLRSESDAFLSPPQPPAGTALRGSAEGRTAGQSAADTSSAIPLAWAPLAAPLLVAALLSSRRRSQSSRTACRAEKMSLEQIKEGDKFDGEVVRDGPIGVYLNIGAEKDALLPRNQVAPGKKYKAGDKIKDLIVTEVSSGATPADRKIRVSTNRTVSDFKMGGVVQGTVVNTAAYGVFFNIGCVKNALAPLRMLAKEPEAYVTGEEVELTIVSIEGDKITVSAGTMGVNPNASGAGGEAGTVVRKLKVGQKVDGIVVRANAEFGLFLNIGAEVDALCRPRQLEKPVDQYKQGDKLTGLKICNVNVDNRQVEVSTRPLASEVKVGQKLEGTVVNISAGGVFFDAGLASDVLGPGVMLDKEPSKYSRGEVADLLVMEVKGERVTVSTKGEEEMGTPLTKLVRGAAVTSAKVKRVDMNMGIFLDVGASRDALWRLKGPGASVSPKPINEYQPGEEVPGLFIISVDVARSKLEVGTTEMASGADIQSMSSLKVGDKVDGVVSRTMEFGVFVNIGAERDALYSASQLAKPMNEYRAGDKILGLTVVEVDPIKQRLAVSEKKTAAEFTVGDEVKGTVSKIMPFGCFVNIGASTDALAPARFLEKDPGSYVPGEDLPGLKILSTDPGSNKITVAQNEGTGGGGGGSSAGRISLADIKVGDKVKGVIRKSQDYGCFLDIGLGRKDALMPKAMLPTGKTPMNYEVNEEVEVYIAQIDVGQERVTVSMIELTEDMKKAPGFRRDQAGATSGVQSQLPTGEMVPDPMYHAKVLGREDLIDEEPTPWYGWEKKFPGLVKFPEKETEIYLTGRSYGFSGPDSTYRSQVAHLPIPVHLRKADAGPAEVPPFSFDDYQISYDYGIKPEIHIKYRQAPFNDPNWVYRNSKETLTPIKVDVLREMAVEFERTPPKIIKEGEEPAAPVLTKAAQKKANKKK